MNVIVTLNSGLGNDLGPNFNLTANVGSVTPSTATKSQLLSGLWVSVDNSATQIIITSTGTCTNSLTLSIGGFSTTTTSTSTSTTSTTSTTTAAPASFVLGYALNFFTACLAYTNNPITHYAANGSTLAINTILYENQSLTILAAAGYYSDGINWYQVESGTGKIVATGSCATTSTTSTTSTSTSTTSTSTTSTSTTSTSTSTSTTTSGVNSRSLGYNDSDVYAACAASPSTYYLQTGDDLVLGGVLYSDINLFFEAPDGYYSNGTNYWFIDSTLGGPGEIIDTGICTTTSTTSTSTTTVYTGGTCYTATFTSVPNDLYVRYRSVLDTIVDVLVNDLTAVDNGDGTYTVYICVKQGSSYAIPACVQNDIEVSCPITWVAGGVCTNNGDCQPIVGTSTTTTSTTLPGETTTTSTSTTSTSTTSTTTIIGTCYTMTYTSIANDLYVRYRNTANSVVDVLINSLNTIDNGDGSYTAYICVRQDGTYAVPACVQGGVEVSCPYSWVSGGICSSDNNCEPIAGTTTTTTSTSTSTSTTTAAGSCIYITAIGVSGTIIGGEPALDVTVTLSGTVATDTEIEVSVTSDYGVDTIIVLIANGTSSGNNAESIAPSGATPSVSSYCVSNVVNNSNISCTHPIYGTYNCVGYTCPCDVVATSTSTTTQPPLSLYLASTLNGACTQTGGQTLTSISYTGGPAYCDFTTLNSSQIPSLSDGTYYVSDGTNVRAWTKTSTPSALYNPGACSACTTTSTTTTTTTTTIAPTASDVSIDVQNSLDIVITDVKVDGVSVTINSPNSYPIEIGTNPNVTGTVNKVGTYTVVVYFGCSIGGQHIEVTDSTNTTTCQNAGVGSGQTLTFTGQYLDGISSPSLRIEGFDGTC